MDYLNRYLDACRKAEIKVEVLFCATERPYPKGDIDTENFEQKVEFLGYDYGYPGGLYYSCVYHELSIVNELCIANKFNGFKSNKYGLFNTYEEYWTSSENYT